MRTFIWVSDHPFFAVTDAAGEFELRYVPEGEYNLEAWHSYMGLKTRRIRVVRGRVSAPVEFTYDGSEDEPAENMGELDGLF